MAQLEDIACPLCSNTASFLPVRVPGRDLHIHGYGALYDGIAVSQWKICGQCGFVHQNPRPSIEALNRFYLEGNYHTKIDVPPDELFASHAPYYLDEVTYAIDKSGIATGAVFDIGCGLGVALKLFQDRGWDCYGIEPDRGRFEYGRDHYGLTNTVHGALDAKFDLGRQVDLVFTHHAFEHFADLPAVMTAITKLLKPGGFMFTAIPTFRDNKSTMSKLWMNSAHYSLFSDRSFNQLLARYGFEEVDHRYNPWKAGPDQLGHLARFTGSPTAPERFYEDPHAVARYLKLVNPLRSAVYLPLRGGYRGYRHYLERYGKLARAAGRVLVTEPNQFFARTAAYLRRK